MPIIAKESGKELVVGVIEAGCEEQKESDTVTTANIIAIKEFASKFGKEIGENRTYMLLASIAKHAMDITGAESASIHVYENTDLIFQSGAGKATPELLKNFPPRRPDGIGWQAIKSGENIIVGGEKFSLHYQDAFKSGIQSMGAFPLLSLTGSGIRGVLYIHFWREGNFFTRPILDILELLTKQIAVVIQNFFFMELAITGAEQAWQTSILQNFIHSLTTFADPMEVLEKIARNMLLYFTDVDCVVLYQYFQSQRKFDTPPIMSGVFLFPREMRSKIGEEDALWTVTSTGESRYIQDIMKEAKFTKLHSKGSMRFVEREQIKSAAHIPLKAHSGEIVGILFVNYRTHHCFTVEEKRSVDSFAYAAGMAIEHARILHKEKMQKEIDSAFRLKTVASNILSGLSKIVEYSTASLQLIQGDNRSLLDAVGFNINMADPYFLRPISKDQVIRKIVESRQPTIIPNTSNHSEWEQTSAVRSWVGLPIVFDNTTIGLITIDHLSSNKFENIDRDRIVQFSNDAAIELQKAILYNDAQHRINNLELLNDITSYVGSIIDTSLLADRTAARIMKGFDCDQCTIYLTDIEDGSQVLTAKACHGLFSESISQRKYRLGKKQMVSSIVYEPFFKGGYRVYDNVNDLSTKEFSNEQRGTPRSVIVAAISAGEYSIGVIVAEKNDERFFAESQGLIAHAIGRSIGLAIQRNIGVDLLQKLGLQILKATRVDEVLQEIVSGVLSLSSISSAVIHLLDDKQEKVINHFCAHCSADPVRTREYLNEVTKAVVGSGTRVIIPDTELDDRVTGYVKNYFKTLYAIPLKIDNLVVGILFLFSRIHRDYSHTETLLLESIANQAALVIQKTSLFQATREKLKTAEERRDYLQQFIGITTVAGELFHSVRKPFSSISPTIQFVQDDIDEIISIIGELKNANVLSGHKTLDESISRNVVDLYNKGKSKLEHIKKDLDGINRKVKETIEMVESASSTIDLCSKRIESLRKVRLNRLLDDALLIVEQRKGSAIFSKYSVIKGYSTCDDEVETHDDLLRVILVNIISNAIESCSGGGELNIETNVKEINGSRFAEVLVRDNGMGINEADLKNIFDIEYSKKSNGVGFGLFFVNIGCKAIGITIDAENNIQRGMTFRLKIPISNNGENNNGVY